MACRWVGCSSAARVYDSHALSLILPLYLSTFWFPPFRLFSVWAVLFSCLGYWEIATNRGKISFSATPGVSSSSPLSSTIAMLQFMNSAWPPGRQRTLSLVAASRISNTVPESRLLCNPTPPQFKCISSTHPLNPSTHTHTPLNNTGRFSLFCSEPRPIAFWGSSGHNFWWHHGQP